MISLIFSAIILGITLSIILIGPVFFILMETIFLKGIKAAIIMNLGVLFSDIFCITLAYYSNLEISNYIKMHPYLFKIGTIIIFIYGWYTFYYRNNFHFNNEIFMSNNILKFFIKGFIINFLNIGIIIFWISIVFLVSIIYNHSYKFFLYMFITLITFFSMDLLKIFLIRKFCNKFEKKLVFIIKKILGIFLILFGFFLFIKTFFSIPSVKINLPFHIFKNF